MSRELVPTGWRLARRELSTYVPPSQARDSAPEPLEGLEHLTYNFDHLAIPVDFDLGKASAQAGGVGQSGPALRPGRFRRLDQRSPTAGGGRRRWRPLETPSDWGDRGAPQGTRRLRLPASPALLPPHPPCHAGVPQSPAGSGRGGVVRQPCAESAEVPRQTPFPQCRLSHRAGCIGLPRTVSHIHAYDFRHWWASQMLRERVAIGQAQRSSTTARSEPPSCTARRPRGTSMRREPERAPSADCRCLIRSSPIGGGLDGIATLNSAIVQLGAYWSDGALIAKGTCVAAIVCFGPAAVREENCSRLTVTGQRPPDWCPGQLLGEVAQRRAPSHRTTGVSVDAKA